MTYRIRMINLASGRSNLQRPVYQTEAAALETAKWLQEMAAANGRRVEFKVEASA